MSEPAETTAKRPRRVKKLVNGRMFQQFQYDHRRSRKCLQCPGYTFNGAGVCTGCMNGVPLPDRETIKRLKGVEEKAGNPQ